ncbi:MAG: chromate transporter, partial [Oscillospiraceae bacterium]|nr:chromate transporter [Oscillospiraceae bacterium]
WSVIILVLVNTELYKATGVLTDLFRWKNVILFLVIWTLTNLVKPVKNLHPIVFIALAAVCGIVFKLGGV